MAKHIVTFKGTSKTFTNVFNAPAKCSKSIGFRLKSDGSYEVTGLATVEQQIYKFWKHSLADVFEGTDGFDKDIIINLYDSAKFKAVLNYFPDKFDLICHCEFDKEYSAYVAKKISVNTPELNIDFACAELVLGYEEYTQTKLEEKTKMLNQGNDFSLDWDKIEHLIRLCNVGTFDSGDSTLNIEGTAKGLVAYNMNFRSIVDTSKTIEFERVSIKSKLLSVLDANNNWHIQYDNLPNGGTKWLFSNEDKSVIVVLGGLVHSDNNKNVDSDVISEEFDKQFQDYLKTE